MGEADAIGDIATGALMGRAVDPAPAHGDDGVAHGVCLNCGTALIGPHCYRCGQSGHIHRSFGAIFHEILHGVVHFEGRLWSTLPMLVFRPGELTRRYVAGERARFVSPMALFLFSVFTMFAIFSIVGVSPPAEISSDVAVRAGLEQTQSQIVKARREAIADRDALAVGDPKRAKLDSSIKEMESDYRNLSKMLPVIETRAKGAVFMGGITTGWKRLDKGIEKANKNPALALYKLQANSYKFSWLLIPLSLPFMWLLFFWKRQYRMYDHAVFVTYSLAFVSLLFIVLTVLGTVGVTMDWLAPAGIFIPVLHLYRQLRGAYSLRRRSAIARTIVLGMFIQIILTLFLLLTLGLGLVG